MISKAVNAFVRIDIPVNDAGVAYRNYLADTSTEEYDEIMDTNVKGIFSALSMPYLICLSVEKVSVKKAGS